jgi:hypothetical protein
VSTTPRSVMALPPPLRAEQRLPVVLVVALLLRLLLATAAPVDDRTPRPVAPVHVSLETWRWLPHSYAIIGMNLALTLRKMQLRGEDVRVSLVEAAPLHNSVIDWRDKRASGMFSAGDTLLLESMPLTHDHPYADSIVPDVVVKLTYPFNTSTYPCTPTNGSCRRPLVFTYGTVEKKRCPPDMLTEDSPRWEDARVRMLTPSAWSAAGLRSCGVRADLIDVLPNGYDPSVFFPPSDAERSAACVCPIQITELRDRSIDCPPPG